jgi:alkanesulfonate monooxygenase SsuD/methylene tetrahydromethanopterin reductase-like flavin-dependent oxidoreductase (luciferase family)
LRFFFAPSALWQGSWPVDQALIQEVEDLGFWGVLVPDMYMWDEEYYNIKADKYLDALLEPWIALSFLAAKTDRIRLGTWVTPLPLRPPNLLAKMVATLDNVSSGRVILGVGAGATKRMFEAYGEWTDGMTRAKKTEEALDLIIKLWTEEGDVNFRGRYYRVKNAVLEPKPLQRPHPPLLFGGAGRRMLRLAGRFADICYIPPWTKLSREDAREFILTEARKFKRRKSSISFADTLEGANPPEYDRDLYFKKVEEAERGGCEYFMAPFSYGSHLPWRLTSHQAQRVTQNCLEHVRDFATTVMPSFSD